MRRVYLMNIYRGMPITKVVQAGYNSNVFFNKIPYYSQFSPTSVGSCSLWLDGADPAGNGVVPAAGNLATWVDKSSSAINAIAGTAVYPQYNRAFLNGLGVVGLTNAADYFTVANNFNSSSLTYVFVMKPTIANTGGNCGLLSTDTSGLFGRSIGLNNMVFQIEYYNGFTATSVTTNSTTWYIISIVFNGTSSITLSYNGVISTYAGSGTGTNSSGLTIGSYNNASSYTTYNANFYLAEALVYTTALSQTQFQQVESYLAQKWGLSSSLAAGHLDKTFPAGSPTAIQPYTTSVQTVIGVRFFPPGIPTISAPTNTNNVITLTMTWTAPIVTGTYGTTTGYIVYILAAGVLVSGTGIGTGGTQTLGNVFTATLATMTTNVAYSYYVIATGPGGNGIASATSSTTIYYATPTAPTINTPTNTGTTLNMTWNAPTGTVTSYTVYVLAAGSLTSTLSPGNVLSTTYSPMTSSVAYSFYVKANNGTVSSGNSLTSATVTYTGPPATPTSLSIDRIGLTFANFTVSAVTNATSYTVNVYSVSTRTNTGGTLVSGGTATSSTTSISIPFNYGNYFPAGFYYATVTATNSSGTSSAFTCPQIVTMIGYTGANQTWTSPITGNVVIHLCGGGASVGTGAGGNGGLVIATFAASASTGYTVAVGGAGKGVFGETTGGWGGISGVGTGGANGAGGYSGAGMSQFNTNIYAGGGGGGGNSTSLCTDGNGGNGGDAGAPNGTAGGNGINHSPQSNGGAGATQSAVGAGGAGGGGGGAGAAGSTRNGGAGGTGTVLGGCGGGGGYFGGGGSGGLNANGPTGGGGGGSSFATGVTNITYVSGGALNGIPDYRASQNGFNGSCAIIW